MTPLRQRMIHDLTIRGLAENTQKSYLQAVTGLARHYRRSPDQLSAQDVQAYLVWLHEKRHLSWRTSNTIRHGLRFFYRITLGWPEPYFYLPGAKEPSKLPEVLNHEELVRLFTVTTNRKQRALLMTTYAAGLRASEVTRSESHRYRQRAHVHPCRARQGGQRPLRATLAAPSGAPARLLAPLPDTALAVPRPSQ